MSISTRQENYQERITLLRQYFADLADNMAGSVYSSSESVSTDLASEHLLSVFLLWSQDIPLILVSHGGTKHILQLQRLAEELQKEYKTSRYIWSISGQLSEQELLGDVSTEQANALHNFFMGSPGIYIVDAEIIQQSLPSRKKYQKTIITIAAGEKYSLSKFTQSLITRGYQRHRTTLEAGSFIVRGEHILVSHPAKNETITVMFSGSVIERIIRTKNRRQEEVRTLKIFPVLFPQETAALTHYPSQCLLFTTTELPENVNVKTVKYNAPKSDIRMPKELREDFEKVSAHLVPQKVAASRPVSYEEALELIGQLEVGKPAVHVDHGIGIFEGLQTRTIEDIPREYLIVRYAEGDTLSVPVGYAYKITPYIGSSQPQIHRLHGTVWQKAKKKAQQDAALFAKDLLSIAAARSATKKQSYVMDEKVDHELDATFPHTLSPDQVRSWEEVKKDLTSPEPMDRLVVGDVGFGKTEIAYRAARQVVANGRQVAVLAPTTLLVQQHYDLFKSRLPKDVGSVHLLSRFQTGQQRAKTKIAIASGKASIVVGTHALLSNTLQWNNLGLVIIDEEQRFGVKQKEHFKKLRSSIDVLSLSATPIPRTLSMALSGLRTLSLISTPPTGRKEVNTRIGRLDDITLKKAITHELARSGQVYAVAPRIRQLAKIEHDIKRLVPEANIAIAHGQLPDDTLANIVHSFDLGEIDVLICSSIVEHGLDLPNANTMIVFSAPHFGLSELYQLRGRIGRRQTRGYAYFFYNQENLTAIQRQRLAALTEASRLGSGWELARRDLEIRGAGNLVGAEQSGSADAVGVQMYLDMVHTATEEQAHQIHPEAEVALPFPSLLPPAYIPDPTERTRWYVRLSRAKDIPALENRIEKLKKENGPPPKEVQNLFLSIKLAKIAGAVGITKISTSKVTPPDEDPYDRMAIESKNLPETLRVVSTLGNWQVRGNAITWDIDEVTPKLTKKLMQILQPV